MPNLKYPGLMQYAHNLVDKNRTVHKSKLIDDVQNKYGCSRNHAIRSIKVPREALGLIVVNPRPRAYLRRCRECSAIFKGRTKTVKKCYDCSEERYKQYTTREAHQVNE